MTNFYGPNNPTEVNDGFPGASPVPGGALMTGNPYGEPSGVTYSLPGNQNAPQQLTSTQISSGNIVTSSVPTNVVTAPGTDSLLAQMSRGQVMMGDSTYGQSQFVPANGGASNIPQAAVTPVTARVASTLTYQATGAAQNYTGN
jgi:hypothetical protein